MPVDREELIEILKAVEGSRDIDGDEFCLRHINIAAMITDLEFGEPVTDIRRPV